MTQDQISTLSKLIDWATDVRPSLSPEIFMHEHWLPFIHTLSMGDRRMAWQVYLKAQAKQFHAIAEYIQTLPPAQLQALNPMLENLTGLANSIRKLGEVKAVA